MSLAAIAFLQARRLLRAVAASLLAAPVGHTPEMAAAVAVPVPSKRAVAAREDILVPVARVGPPTQLAPVVLAAVVAVVVATTVIILMEGGAVVLAFMEQGLAVPVAQVAAPPVAAPAVVAALVEEILQLLVIVVVLITMAVVAAS